MLQSTGHFQEALTISPAATSATRPGLGLRAWLMVALMVALSGMSYFDRTIMSIAGPGIMKEFGFSETAMGSVYSAFLLSYTIMMLPGGWLADRFGARLVLTVGGLGAALCTGATSLCASVIAFLAMRAAFGVFTAPLYPSCGRISANWVPVTAQGWVQALIMGGAAVGSAISPIAVSAMIVAYGWRISFWIAAAITAVLIAGWYGSVRDYPPGAAPAPTAPRRREWRALLTSRDLMFLTLGYFLINYFEYIFFYWMYYYFGQIRHLSGEVSARATSSLFVTMAIMTPLGGWISDKLIRSHGQRFGRAAVSMTGMVLSAVLLYFGAGGYSVGVTVALLSFALGCATLAEGPFWAAAIEISGDQVGTACGILNTGGNLGGSFAPFLTPLIASRFGWTGGLYFGSLMVLLGVLTWFFVNPERKIGSRPSAA